MKVLFLHGLGQDSTSWEQTAHQLDVETVECLEVIPKDLKEPRFQQLADRLEKKLKAEKEPVLLCGLSLGAVLGIELSIRQPEKIAGLILIAPQYKIPTVLMDLQNVMFRCLPNKFFASMGQSKQAILSITRSMRRLDYGECVKTISCPVHIVCGEKDRANKKAALALHEFLPASSLSFVPHAAHEVNRDNPTALAAIIQAASKETVNSNDSF